MAKRRTGFRKPLLPISALVEWLFAVLAVMCIGRVTGLILAFDFVPYMD